MEVSERLIIVSEDVTELEGKKVELLRKKNRLNNHKQVFLAELERIETELNEVNCSLNDINKQYNSAKWLRMRLRCFYFFQLLLQCLYYIGTFLAFLSMNFLYILYLIMATAAYLSRAILDSQLKSFSEKSTKSEFEDSLTWS